MENMRRIINIQAGKPVLGEPETHQEFVKGHKTALYTPLVILNES